MTTAEQPGRLRGQVNPGGQVCCMQMRNPMCVQEEGGQLDSSEEGQGNGQARVERERERVHVNH
jgi:hypothetical protein